MKNQSLIVQEVLKTFPTLKNHLEKCEMTINEMEIMRKESEPERINFILCENSEKLNVTVFFSTHEKCLKSICRQMLNKMKRENLTVLKIEL